MPQDRYFLTGDAIFENNWQVVVTIPKSQGDWLYGVFLGYLELLGRTWPWVTGGESTPDDAAAAFRAIYDGIRPMVIQIGDIKWSAVNIDISSGWLACTGTLYDSTVYPDLYAAIGTTFNQTGDPAGGFRVPDMRGRISAGPDLSSGRITASWGNTLGGSGGEESHTLITSEMPSHTHEDVGHLHSIMTGPDGVALTPGELPVHLPEVIPGVTGTGNASLTTVGGDSAHNNLQPTIILFPYILAKI